MKKNEIKNFAEFFDYCFEKGKNNVIKNLELTEEEKEEICETTIFKQFTRMHENINDNNLSLCIEDSNIFIRRIEYMIAVNYL